MNNSITELIKLYHQFIEVTPLQLPNDHDFSRFISWLERSYWKNQ